MSKKIILSLCTLLTLFFQSSIYAVENSDRADIVAAINCFTNWDLNGGTEETVEPCIYKDVVYQRVDVKGDLIRYTPGFEYDGKGADDYVPYITELEIFGNMAMVKTHKHRDAPNKAYMKAFILYKLNVGWRITNVVWGGVTPQL